MYYFIQIFVCAVCRLVFKIFLSLKVQGLENFESIDQGGVIFAANHGGKLDSFLIACSLPVEYFKKMKRLRFMASPKYSENKSYSPIIRMLGAYSIYPGAGDYEKSLTITKEILKDNQSLVIFPTGRIEAELVPTNARPGIAYLAKELNPVLSPVFVANSNKITCKEFFSGQRHVKVIFGQPFKLGDISQNCNDLRGNAKLIMERVLALKPLPEFSSVPVKEYV